MKIEEVGQMGEIKFYTSVALDAICYLETRCRKDKRLRKEEQDAIDELEEKLGGRLDNDYICASNLCYIISAYTHNQSLENLSLQDLIHILENIEDVNQIVREKVTNDFTASYIFFELQYLVQGRAEDYIKRLKVLQDIGFENFWYTKILPKLQEQIALKAGKLDQKNPSQLLDNIAYFKATPPIEEVKVYEAYFSGNVAFALHGGNLLDMFNEGIDIYQLVGHELMHGFASSKLTKYYEHYVEQDAYLREKNRLLLQSSGNEEDFVMAADHYLMYISGNKSEKELRDALKKRYGGNLPVASIIFELLLQEEKIPYDYNGWLIRQFEENKFPTIDIENYIKNL